MMQKTIAFITTVALSLVILTDSFAQTQSTNQKFRLLTYGFPYFERQNAENVIAQKWGIEFYAVAGCVVTEEFEDSVAQQNQKVEPLIEKKYGKDWRGRFDKEVEVEFEAQKKMAALIDELEYVKRKQTEMEKEGNGLHYVMTPIANSTKYNVLVQGWGKWNGEDEWVTYYQLLVDNKTKAIKLLNDKIVKE